jgi:hypothetical protein
VESPELMEELDQLQAEFGPGKCKLVDQYEERWLADITRIEFDPVNQVYIFVSDR